MRNVENGEIKVFRNGVKLEDEERQSCVESSPRTFWWCRVFRLVSNTFSTFSRSPQPFLSWSCPQAESKGRRKKMQSVISERRRRGLDAFSRDLCNKNEAETSPSCRPTYPSRKPLILSLVKISYSVLCIV